METQTKRYKDGRDCREGDSGSVSADCALGGIKNEKEKSGDGWRGRTLGGQGTGATAELTDTKRKTVSASEHRGRGGGK